MIPIELIGTNLVGIWVGTVQGYAVEMKLVLDADGSAEYEGMPGTWRVQGSKIYLTESGETVAYDYRLQGSQLLVSGGDLMAPLALTRSGGDAPQVRQRMPAAPNQEEETVFGGPEPSGHAPKVIWQASQTTPPATTRAPARNRGLSPAEIVQLMEGSVPTSHIAGLVGERGISFVMTPAIASQLRAKGASSELIEALNRARGQTVPAEALTPTRRTGTGGAAGMARRHVLLRPPSGRVDLTTPRTSGD